VAIFGERVRVAARIHTLGGFSAHAGQSELVLWAEPALAGRPRVVLTHGEDKPRAALAEAIRRRFGCDPVLPRRGDLIEA
jgi:metallo-beta-lactamase family protein